MLDGYIPMIKQKVIEQLEVDKEFRKEMAKLLAKDIYEINVLEGRT